MKTILIALSLFVLVSCSDSEGTTKALENLGMVEIETHGWGWFGCGDDDDYTTKFTAINPTTNEAVKGVGCSGILKGTTIRFK